MSNKKKYIVLSIAGFLILSSIIAFYNRQLIMAWYDNAKNNPFKTGDKVYAHQYFILDDNKSEIALFRIIKSTSSFIGTYLKNKLLPISVDTLSGIVRLYAIDPNPKTINSNDTIPKALPKGYIFADKYLYVFWGAVTNKELNSFEK
ncbi:hypothetical protein [Mucilaginibacter sp. SG564]|uniref:hypothetical protein n=1 Tax=Mucilaginibacter sp. SG564 TaxID=2587022 RepID=UPI001552FA1D|nr:hypothetical protein [Mucilaginibacter sp. SG564]NOW97230.1 hypothetical protein [Mucilaginibacter sp. SG564]